MGSSKKRKKRGFNFLVYNDFDIVDKTNEEMDVKSFIDVLIIVMEVGFVGLRVELDKLIGI